MAGMDPALRPDSRSHWRPQHLRHIQSRLVVLGSGAGALFILHRNRTSTQTLYLN